ncbi:MAG: DUF5063 domain-containing protein [Terriglobales bacterium]
MRTAFREFGLVASEFCSVVDSTPALDRVVLLSRLYEILPRLVHQGVALPSISVNETNAAREIRQTRLNKAEWGGLYELLKAKLGEWDLYWEVFDPTKDSEAIRGSLADDIADVYRDIKEGLGCQDLDLALQGDAIWEWRVGFYSHWGKHAIDALRTIHFLLENVLS